MYSENFSEKTSGLYPSLKDFLSDDISPVDEIIFGTGRGDVAQLVSVTDVGKTTLILNTCLRIAAGESSFPLAPNVSQPRRVVYVDFEATRAKLRDYLLVMRKNFNRESWVLIEENFIPFCDVVIGDEPLSLSNTGHLERIKKEAPAADLIVIDTISAAFDLNDENSNSEVKRVVMRPLKRLAQETNSAVLFCHHAGKPSESTHTELAYTGRGASTFGALSRVVFTLTKNKLKGASYVTLQCAKAKRSKFDPVLLYLNRDKAWFEICDEKPVVEQKLTAQEVADFVATKPEVQRQEIVEQFKNRTSGETVDRRLIEAQKLGLIFKIPKRMGWYSAQKPIDRVN